MEILFSFHSVQLAFSPSNVSGALDRSRFLRSPFSTLLPTETLRIFEIFIVQPKRGKGFGSKAVVLDPLFAVLFQRGGDVTLVQTYKPT